MAYDDFDTAQIAKFYKTGYSNFIRLNAMQEKSALASSVDKTKLAGTAKRLYSYDTPTLVERTVRAGANTAGEVPRNWVQISPRFWEFTEYFDPRDEVQLIDSMRPDSQYARAVLAAFERKYDDLIIAAMDGDRITADGTRTFGQDLPTAIEDNNTLRQTATTPVGPEDIISAVMRLNTLEVQKNVEWICAIHPIILEQLLNAEKGTDVIDPRITSMDYNGMKDALQPLRTGEIAYWMGLKFISTPAIPEEDVFGAGTESGYWTYVFAADAIVLGVDKDVEIHFDIIADRGHSLQNAHYLTSEAVRMFDTKIVRVGGTTDGAW